MPVPSQEQPAKQAARWEPSNFQGNRERTESSAVLSSQCRSYFSTASSPFAFLIHPFLCQGRSQESSGVAHPEASPWALQLLGDFQLSSFKSSPPGSPCPEVEICQSTVKTRAEEAKRAAPTPYSSALSCWLLTKGTDEDRTMFPGLGSPPSATNTGHPWPPPPRAHWGQQDMQLLCSKTRKGANPRHPQCPPSHPSVSDPFLPSLPFPSWHLKTMAILIEVSAWVVGVQLPPRQPSREPALARGQQSFPVGHQEHP